MVAQAIHIDDEIVVDIFLALEPPAYALRPPADRARLMQERVEHAAAPNARDSISASGWEAANAGSRYVESRTGPLPLRAAPSVTAFDDMARMKLQPRSLSRELAGMLMAQNSVTVSMRLPLSFSETGNSTALIWPGKRD